MRSRFLCAVLLLALVLPAGAADPVWIQLASPNFVLFTDTTEAKGRRLLEDFEGRVAALSGVLGEIPQRQFPIEIFLFSKREEFLETAPKPAGPDAPPEFAESAYLLKGPDRTFVVARDKSPEDIGDDVGHALGHVFFERFVMWRPFWLAEGAAEYFRKVGRNPDSKKFSEPEAYPAADLLEIVQSRDYKDDAPATPFRLQAHRLLRVVATESAAALREFLAGLKTREGREAQLKTDSAVLQGRFAAYTETRIASGPGAFDIRMLPSTPGTVAIHRGDLLLAAKKTSEAVQYYNGESRDARIARAVLTRFSRSSNEAIRVLDRTFREMPDAGLPAFHLGSIETKIPTDIELQVRALERAVELLPKLGRAHGQLARAYALAGNGEEALKQVDRALELEPEFADEYFAIQSEAFLALLRYTEAVDAMRTAAALPHSSASLDYDFRASEMARRVEQTRREAEDRRLQQIRAEVAAQVAEREPPPPPPSPPPPQRFGSVQYSMQATREIVLLNSPLPDFPSALVQKGVQGRIDLIVSVGIDGKVTQVSISSSEVPEMNAATLDAVRKWVFAPVRNARGPIAHQANLIIGFSVR